MKTRLAVPAAVFAVLVVAAFGDGYFRDELYYLACTRRMAWGYVDHPPLCVALLWVVRHAAGESLLVLRAVAALATAAVVWMTGSLARRLGADAFGQLLAMVAAAIAPELLGIGSFYSMNILEVVFWTAAARLLVEILDRPTDTRWVTLGLLLGLGLLNKISVLWLGAGIAAGLVLTPARHLLLTRGPWLAGAIAGVIFLPHVLWQVTHDWPTLEFIRNASRDKMQSNPPLSFLADQVMNLHPVALPIWLAGLVALLAGNRFRQYRPLGIAFLTVAVILILNRTSRSGYLLPAFPMLIAAGAAWWSQVLQRTPARAAVLVLLAVAGAATLPLAVPVLPVESYVRYSRALGVAPSTEERQQLGRLPQFFADRQGWDRFVDQIGSAWDRLTPDERSRAVIVTSNYGEAGAIELMGRSRGMVAASGHNNYWLWGPPSRPADVAIFPRHNRTNLDRLFAEVEQVGQTDCGDCMPYENQLPIFICRGPRTPLAVLWPSFKHFN
jgi:4-amino-4-deoxy-L-arabinose transferase-like glycosyltransferase